MTGCEPSTHQPRPRLAETTRAILLGVWWSPALPPAPEPLDGSSERARLLAVHRALAASMRMRAHGDLRSAADHLQSAIRALPPMLTRPDPDGEPGRRVALLPRPPATADPLLLRCTQWTACAAWREQTELAGLRRRYEGPRSRTDEWVDACVEYLARVEFVTTWTTTDHVDAVRTAPHRQHMRQRVERLRRWADPSAGDVGVGVWRRLGGYPGLRAEALRALAEQPLAEWRSDPRSHHVPVDHGRTMAWSYARDGRAALSSLVVGAPGETMSGLGAQTSMSRPRTV